MNPACQSSSESVRRWVYALLIAVAAGGMAGRILSAQLVLEPSLYQPGGRKWPEQPPRPMPTFSSNDRSRWCTIRALVEEGTYAIGKRTITHQGMAVAEPLVQRVDGAFVYVTADGRKADYAVEDSGIFKKDGWGTIDVILHPERLAFYSSKPPFLPTLLAGEYWLCHRLFGWTLADDPWKVVCTVLFTINWAPLVLYLVVLARLVERYGTSDWGRLFVMAAACFGTYLTAFSISVNNHVVAAWGALFAVTFFLRLWRQEGGRGSDFALTGFFAAWTAANELPAASLGVALFILCLLQDARRTLLCFVPAALLPIGGFLLTNYLALGEIMPAYEKFGTVWYEFPGSYWSRKRGIDAAADPVWLYGFHLLLGHHGLFSLSPIFVLSLAGMFAWRKSPPLPPIVAVMALLLSLAVLVFYLERTNNYGGWTNGPRWFFWLIPLWLLTMVPTSDRWAASRGRRRLAYVLLGLSVLSTSYYAWNPWRHPWLYNFLEGLGVVRY